MNAYRGISVASTGGTVANLGRSPTAGRSPTNGRQLRSRSKKRSAMMKEVRVPLIESLIRSGVGCLICPLLQDESISTNCAGIQGLHERRKRSSGGSLINPLNLIPACNWSNGFIEDNPKLIRDLFGQVLVVREGDEDWEQLGSRNDRYIN